MTIQKITNEQLQELKQLRNDFPELVGQLQNTFENECKVYDNGIYGMYGIFSDDTFDVNCI